MEELAKVARNLVEHPERVANREDVYERLEDMYQRSPNPAPDTQQLQWDVVDVLAQLKAQIQDQKAQGVHHLREGHLLAQAEKDQHLVQSCHRCRGLDFAISVELNLRTGTSDHSGELAVRYILVICRGCGDLGMRALDLEQTLRGQPNLFRKVTAQSVPYR